MLRSLAHTLYHSSAAAKMILIKRGTVQMLIAKMETNWKISSLKTCTFSLHATVFHGQQNEETNPYYSIRRK